MQFQKLGQRVRSKKRKFGEPDVNPNGASSSTADTPKRRESKQGYSAENGTALCWVCCGSKHVGYIPFVDLNKDRTALSGESWKTY